MLLRIRHQLLQAADIAGLEIARLQARQFLENNDVDEHALAAVELVRLKPDVVPRMMGTLSEQPAKIGKSMAEFSAAFEKTLEITR